MRATVQVTTSRPYARRATGSSDSRAADSDNATVTTGVAIEQHILEGEVVEHHHPLNVGGCRYLIRALLPGGIAMRSSHFLPLVIGSSRSLSCLERGMWFTIIRTPV